ncbi:penicillin-binding transpeptidase domain-containing protein [Citrobacter sp. JGM124]|uniref:penicillin-binding transpeptidase domain-containing protein n=1 Tax=Citrobacter sp. JGM124 TaxID=2799789 RepID=UPI001BAC29A1|nr:penicillin-binding transpeptidase domain-containing protein [Citrobacter sp. JGM124]MBS0847738.1 peptidoglycan synthase [Citrobacter sp. JGM124]
MKNNIKNKKQSDKKSFFLSRYNILLFCILACVVLLLGRVADLQFFNQQMLVHEANLRSLKTIVLPTARSTLTDRNGEVLAMSVPSRDIVANPQDIVSHQTDFDNAKWRYLAGALNTTPEQLKLKIYHNDRRHFLFLERKVEQGIAHDISALHVAGISETSDYSRFYPMGEAAAPLIGLVGIDNSGLSGIEHSFNHLLLGHLGKKTYRQDAHGDIVSVLNEEAPQPAPTIQLSIDKYDQYTAFSELRDGVLANNADSGTAVLVKIDTGEILAMASYPSFNPNNMQAVQAAEMRNVAINDSFEPGSTVKPLVIIEGLQRHIITAHTLLDTTPFKVNGHLIRDVGHWPRLTPTGILQKSSDIGVSHIALAMPSDALVNIYQRFGLGKPTKLDLPGESTGYFPLHRQKWIDIERATFSFGYGLRATPLQIARVYATLGAYGVYRPLSITKVTPPVDGDPVADPDIVNTVLHMMESDMLPGGSGVKAAVPGYRLAIKTGTAEKLGDSGKYDAGYVNYTAGVAPLEHPVVALVVVINNPKAGTHFGGSVAAPVFGKIIGPVLEHMNIAADALPGDSHVQAVN